MEMETELKEKRNKEVEKQKSRRRQARPTVQCYLQCGLSIISHKLYKLTFLYQYISIYITITIFIEVCAKN